MHAALADIVTCARRSPTLPGAFAPPTHPKNKLPGRHSFATEKFSRLHREAAQRYVSARTGLARRLRKSAASIGRRGLLRLEELTFEKEGRSIAYRKASLTQEGEELPPTDPLDFILPDSANHVLTARKKTDSKRSGKSISSKTATTPTRQPEPREVSAHAAAIEEKLRTWRLAQAKKHRVPAYCIVGNKTMRDIAATTPHARTVAVRQRHRSRQSREIRRRNLPHLLPVLRKKNCRREPQRRPRTVQVAEKRCFVSGHDLSRAVSQQSHAGL